MHSRSRPGKKLRPKGVKPLKLTTLTHFQLFFKKPTPKSSQNGSQNGVSVWALKITKIQKQEHSNKKNTSRDRKKWVHGHPGGGGLSNAPFSIKITIIPEIVYMGLRASKITARASKMTDCVSKICQISITLLVSTSF